MNIVCFSGGYWNYVAGLIDQNSLHQVDNFVVERYSRWIHETKQCHLMHSAGLLVDGCGFAIAGASMCGKTTLLLRCLSSSKTKHRRSSTGQSSRFVSNDRILLNARDNMMYGVPKLPRANPGTIISIPEIFDSNECLFSRQEVENLEEMSIEALWNVENKKTIRLEKHKFQLEAKMNALVVLNWDVPPSDSDVLIVRPVENLRERKDLLKLIEVDPSVYWWKRENQESGGVIGGGGGGKLVETLVNNGVRIFEALGPANFDQIVRRLREIAADLNS